MSTQNEIPDPDGDFYAPQNVPYGEVRERPYFFKTTQAWRHIFVYTPSDYDTNSTTRCPILYLQHGGEVRRRPGQRLKRILLNVSILQQHLATKEKSAASSATIVWLCSKKSSRAG